MTDRTAIDAGDRDDDDDAMFVEQADARETRRARAAARGRSVRVGAATVQRDEERLLDPWLRYHADLFGARSLAVVDTGSTRPTVLARLERAEAEGVRVVRLPAADAAAGDPAAAHGAALTEALRALEPDHDFLMPLDCAAFVAHQGADGRIDCRPDAVLNHLSTEHRGERAVLLTRGSYLNVPGMPGFYFFKNERRCLFAAGALGRIGRGCHEAEPAHAGAGEKRTALVHFHLRFRPFDDLDEAARRALDAPAKDYAAEGLRGFRGAVLANGGSFATMGREDYERFFRRFDRVPLSPLRNALRRLGGDLPY